MNTGGSAFPTLADNGHSTNQDGMTLRDYFAAKAMQGFLSNSNLDERVGENRVAESAYKVADAMLKAREQ